MYGYVLPVGYVGRMPDGKYQLFDTEGEYAQAYKEASHR